MSKINWIKSPCETYRITVSDKTYGLFYDSKSKLRHISRYDPYARPPYITLCDNPFVNFTGTGNVNNICNICEEQLCKIIDEIPDSSVDKLV